MVSFKLCDDRPKANLEEILKNVQLDICEQISVGAVYPICVGGL